MKNTVTYFEWSDKSWNVFMAHDQQAIAEFIKRKISKQPDITHTSKDMELSEYDKFIKYK